MLVSVATASGEGSYRRRTLVLFTPVPFPEVRRNDQVIDPMSQHCLSRISEDDFRRGIELDDPFLGIDGDDAVEGGVENRTLAFFAVAQGGEGMLAFERGTDPAGHQLQEDFVGLGLGIGGLGA